MIRPRWLQVLHSLGLEFWLPLPLLGLIFWTGGRLVTNQMLNRSSETAQQIQANIQREAEPAQRVLLIKVEINKNQGFSRVTVKTTTTGIKESEFTFPFTEYSQIETAIAQELGLSPEQVRKLLRYRIEN
ncbi:MAG: hypothetical protein ACHBN1_06415 [Heteroscytonema crispum UTEX LB 1556]